MRSVRPHESVTRRHCRLNLAGPIGTGLVLLSGDSHAPKSGRVAHKYWRGGVSARIGHTCGHCHELLWKSIGFELFRCASRYFGVLARSPLATSRCLFRVVCTVLCSVHRANAACSRALSVLVAGLTILWPNKPGPNKKETADLLRKHGGKAGDELKAEGE